MQACGIFLVYYRTQKRLLVIIIDQQDYCFCYNIVLLGVGPLNISTSPGGPCTLRRIYFFIFPTKTEKGHITYPYHICIFQSTEKKRKKENGQENRSFFHFSNFEVKFKNTKNTVNG